MTAGLIQGPRKGYDASVGSGLIRGPKEDRLLKTASWSNTWPMPQSTLDLDFVNNRGWVRGVGQGGVMDAITFTRASTGTYVGSDGLLKTASAGSNVSGIAAEGVWRQDWGSTAQVAQVNLLTYTALTGGTAGTEGSGAVAPTGWFFGFATGSISYPAALTGGGAAARFVASSQRPFIYQPNTLSANSTYTLSVYVDAVTSGSVVISEIVGYSGLSGTTIAYYVNGVSSPGSTVATAGTRVSAVFTVGATGGTVNMRIGLGVNGTVTGDVTLSAPQFQIGSTATTYQQVGSAVPTNTPLAANPTCNGILIEESRQNRILWCRDATQLGQNLLTNSEFPKGVTDAPIRGGLLTATTFSGLNNNTGLAFGYDGTTVTYAYKSGSVNGIQYTFSVYVRMDDGNAPVFGSASAPAATNDFAIVIGGQTLAPNSFIVQNLGGGLYRVSGNAVAGTNNNNGIVKYSSNSNRTFKVSGYQLDNAAAATGYQVTTTTAIAQGWNKSNCTVAKNQIGIDGVANAASSLTATAANATCIQAIPLASGNRTSSIYLKRITGSGNVQVTLDGSTWSTVDLSNGLWNRIVMYGTVTNPCVGVLIATSGDSVAMDFGQVEDGVTATSPILTNNTTFTRAADNATMSMANTLGWYNQNGGTFQVSAITNDKPSVAGATGLFALSDGTTNNRVLIYRSATPIRGYVGVSGVIKYNIVAGTGTILPFKTALCATASYTQVALNGVTPTTALARIESMPALNRLDLGKTNPGGEWLGGCITRLTYIPVRVNDNILRIMTGSST